MGKLPGDSGEGPLLSDGPSPRNMRFTANQAGFHGEGVGVEMRPSPEEGDARSEPGRTGKNRQDGKDWADGKDWGLLAQDRGWRTKEKRQRFCCLFLVPPTGVISNSFLEDLERIWALRDVIPEPNKTP